MERSVEKLPRVFLCHFSPVAPRKKKSPLFGTTLGVQLLSAPSSASRAAGCCLFISFFVFLTLIKMRRSRHKKKKHRTIAWKKTKNMVNKKIPCQDPFPHLFSASGHCHIQEWISLSETEQLCWCHSSKNVLSFLFFLVWGLLLLFFCFFF